MHVGPRRRHEDVRVGGAARVGVAVGLDADRNLADGVDALGHGLDAELGQLVLDARNGIQNSIFLWS